MTDDLHILILEDVPTDAELEERELRGAGIPFVSRRVDTRDDFLRELDGFRPHLILADYALPTFDGLTALNLAHAHCPDVPFIFVSGAIGEERAIESLKSGATDYVLKDRLSRLVPSVRRALNEAEEHRSRRVAEEKVRERTAQLARANEALREENDIRRTRTLTFELASPLLYELGFVEAVGRLAEDSAAVQGIRVDFEDDGQPKPLDDNLRVLLFQCIRELLNNMAKHAHAKTARVTLAGDGGEVRATVADDGVGFAPASRLLRPAGAGGFGLFSIRERLSLLGGRMEIDSEKGRGTRVTLVAPLKTDKESTR